MGQSEDEFYTSQSGIAHADNIRAYCGLLSQCKSDFVAIEKWIFIILETVLIMSPGSTKAQMQGGISGQH